MTWLLAFNQAGISSLSLFEIVEDQFSVALKNAQAPFQSRQLRSRHVRWFLG
jgi:hypothetical protein